MRQPIPQCRGFPTPSNFGFSEIYLTAREKQDYSHSHPASSQRGVSRSSPTLGAGCGGRLGAARRAVLEADGEVVWSRSPDAGIKSGGKSRKATVATKPGSP